MLDYPQAYVIPVGKGQRSDAEANRLVEWALFNDIEVDELEKDYRVGSQTFEKGSYVIFMDQPRRGLADTALSLGVDISSRIQRLYAPPAAWSHGYLWGADTVTIADGARFSPRTDRIHRPNRLKGSVPSGKVAGYTLQVNSPTAVRALNDLVRGGAKASIATAAFSGGPAGTAVFGTDKATKRALEDAADDYGLDFGKLSSGSLPTLEAIERVPRIRVISAFGNAPTGSTAPTPRPRPERLGAAPARLRRRPDERRAAEHGARRTRSRATTCCTTPRPTTRPTTQPIAQSRARLAAVLRGRRRLHRRPGRTARTS